MMPAQVNNARSGDGWAASCGLRAGSHARLPAPDNGPQQPPQPQPFCHHSPGDLRAQALRCEPGALPSRSTWAHGEVGRDVNPQNRPQLRC